VLLGHIRKHHCADKCDGVFPVDFLLVVLQYQLLSLSKLLHCNFIKRIETEEGDKIVQ
jgi:hypothetical protein